MRLAAIALVLLCACIDEPSGSGVLGSRADMTTPAGDYTGYRVVTECSAYTDVGVIGTGSIAVTQTADISAAGNDLHTRIADITSVWGWGGYGLVCEPGIGTQVYLSNWRDVDTVIARAGAFLAERDFAMQVSVTVEGQPVPQAN